MVGRNFALLSERMAPELGEPEGNCTVIALVSLAFDEKNELASPKDDEICSMGTEVELGVVLDSKIVAS
jgi:hypothetical protein